MGERSRRLEALIRKHPFCCFCGGDRATETIEHAPPKVLFVDKHRPKSHEFPACYRCNHMFSAHEQIVAMSALIMGGLFGEERLASYSEKIMKAVARNNPEVFQALEFEKKTWVKSEGQVCVPAVSASVDWNVYKKWLDPWAAKIGAAFFYLHAGAILSEAAAIGVRWMTNASILRDGIPSSIVEALGEFGSVRQGSWDERDQFFYKWALTPERDGAGFLVIIHDSCAAFIVVFSDKANHPRIPEHDETWFQPTDGSGIVTHT